MDGEPSNEPSNKQDGATTTWLVQTVQHVQDGFAEPVEFQLRAFGEQFLYNLLYPLALPVVLACRGYGAATNMAYVPARGTSAGPFVLSTVIAVLQMIAAAGWAMSNLQGGAGASPIQQILDWEMLVLLCSVVFQRIAIATKYAYLPPSQYARQMSEQVPLSELLQEQLLTGWAGLSPPVLEREVRSAMERLGLVGEGFYFHVPVHKLADLQALLCHVSDALPDMPAEPVADGGSNAGGRRSTKQRPSPTGWQATSRSGGGNGRQSVVRPSAAALGESKLLPRPSLLARPAAPVRAYAAANAGRAPALSLRQRASVIATFALQVVGLQATAPATFELDRRDGSGELALEGSGTRAQQQQWGVEQDGELPCAVQLPSPPPRVRVSGAWLVRMLLKRAGMGAQGMAVRLNALFFVLAAASAVLPTAARLAYGLAPLGDTRWQQAASGASFVLSFFFSYVILSYMRSAIVDYRRRCNALKRLAKLCTPDYHTAAATARQQQRALAQEGLAPADSQANPLRAGGSGSPLATVAVVALSSSAAQARSKQHAPPAPPATAALPLDSTGNVLSFLLARRLLAAFGLRYFKRIQAYQSCSLLLCAVIVAAVLATLVLAPPTGAGAAADAPTVVFAAVAIYYGACLSGSVLVCLKYGSAANGLTEEHAALLTARALERRQVQAAAEAIGAASTAREAATCASMIAAARDAVRHDLALDPVRILGLPASYGLLRALAVGLLSAASAAAKLLAPGAVGR